MTGAGSKRAAHGRAGSRTAAPSGFAGRVLWVVRRIPPGRIATYGEVAAMAGRPGAARAVGNIMRECRRPDVPCHRVIAAGGRLGGYGGSEALKRSLLVAEGVPVSGARVRDLDRVRWNHAGGRRTSAGVPKKSSKSAGQQRRRTVIPRRN